VRQVPLKAERIVSPSGKRVNRPFGQSFSQLTGILDVPDIHLWGRITLVDKFEADDAVLTVAAGTTAIHL
jgi:hypothetical protein